MNCTHGGTAMNIAPGARCPWCLQIVAEPARFATAAGVGTGSTALEVPAPAATIAANPVTPTARAAAAAPGAALPPAPGAPIATPSLFVEREQTAWPVADAARVTEPEAPARPGGVATSGAPIARNTDPQAAHDAAARAAHDYRFDEWLVLAAHVASRDLNGDELGAVCGRPYQSVGPRRPALERNGLIEETGTRRKGKGCYRATDAGRSAWADCPESIRPTVLAQLTNTAVMALRGAA